MLKIPSPLTEATEDLVHRTIGCAITVHRTLGPGLLESIYARALCIELGVVGIPFEREREYEVSYRGETLCHQRLDIVVADTIALEIKAVQHLDPVHRAQLLAYLRVSGLPVGLLMNFNVVVLQDGVKRIIR